MVKLESSSSGDPEESLLPESELTGQKSLILQTVSQSIKQFQSIENLKTLSIIIDQIHMFHEQVMKVYLIHR